LAGSFRAMAVASGGANGARTPIQTLFSPISCLVPQKYHEAVKMLCAVVHSQ